jgi:MFS family permease
VKKLIAVRNILFLLVLAILTLVTFPRVLKIGMFVDGVTNASIARNFAEGKGTPWDLHYTEMFPHVHDQVPLGYWLQSWVYRLFGDHLFLDPLWSVGMGFIIIFFLIPLWRMTSRRNGDKTVGAWWPACLFLLSPIVARSLTHNLMEFTMTVFVLAASSVALFGLTRRSLLAQLGYGISSGLLLICASLTKGPPGVFPLVLPLLAAAFLPHLFQWRQALVSTLSITVVLVGGIAIIYFADTDARNFFHAFYEYQIVSRLGARPPGTRAWWWMLYKSIPGLAVPLGIGALGAFLTKSPVHIIKNRRFWFFLAVALSGTLPILLSSLQYGRYLLTSLPFFALAFGSLFESVGIRCEQFLQQRRMWSWGVVGVVTTCVILAFSLMIANAGKVRRAKVFHSDLVRQNVQLEKWALISVCPTDLAYSWELVANMQRVYGASLVPRAGEPLLLVKKGSQCPIPPHCKPLQSTSPVRYMLYRCLSDPG